MSIVIRDAITQAYQLAGVYSSAPGDVPDGDDTAIGVLQLNLLNTQLNVDQLFPFSREVVQVPVLSSNLSYTIGLGTLPAADFVYQRPAFINRILWYPSGNSAPLNVQQLDLPDLLYTRKSVSSMGAPNYFAFNPKFPNAEILFDIRPMTSGQLSLVYNTEIPLVTIDSVLQIPAEYADLMTTALARRLSVLKQMPPSIQGSCDVLYKTAVNRVKGSHSRYQVPTLENMLANDSVRIAKHNVLTG